MSSQELLQYIIDTSYAVLAKKQEATEYLAALEKEHGAALKYKSVATPRITDYSSGGEWLDAVATVEAVKAKGGQG